MELKAKLKRWRYVYSWRLRYWWFDTASGQRARLWLCALSALWFVVAAARMTAMVYLDLVDQTQPKQALVWWAAILVNLLISAAISYATRPRRESPKPVEQEPPAITDGLAAVHIFGIVWIKRPAQLAHKNLRPIPIRTRGGKK